MYHKIKEWSAFELIWLVSFSGIGVFLSLSWGESLFGLSVFITGNLSVVLCAKGSILNYFFGIYNVAAYAWLSHLNGFYGEVFLNAGYYLPMQFIGFYLWAKHLKDKTDVVVMKKQTIKQFLATVVAGVSGTILLGVLLSFIQGQNLPFIDSFTTVFSIIAMLLMVFRFREQWLLWIAVNIVSIIMWSSRMFNGTEGATMMVLMWSAYLINAMCGWYVWNKATKE